MITLREKFWAQYSGGQATEGQGGFYGSGGARVISADDSSTVDSEGRSVVLALAADVQKISQVMKEFERLENLLISEENDSNGTVTGKSIELKSSIKKLMTSPDVLESLNRLEIQGEPVWGLSTEERDLVILARETVNEC